MYSKEKRNEVYEEYVQGKPIYRIAKDHNIPKQTIYIWIEKFNWEEKKEKIDKEILTKLNKNLTEIKEEGISIFDKSLREYAKRLYRGELKIKPRDAVKIHKHLLHLFGRSETSENINVQSESELSFEEMRKIYEKSKGGKNEQ